MIDVSLELMKAGKVADEELWSEYITTINPDYRDYLPYHRWLALQVKNLRMKVELYHDH